ncbi:MAG: hypothetical protein M1830_002534, partial [Pleopsidium flavum]
AMEIEDGDIFEGAGNDYDPLGGLGDDDDDDSSVDGTETPYADEEPSLPLDDIDKDPEHAVLDPRFSTSTDDTSGMPPPPAPHTAPRSSRNYFGDPATADKDHNAATPANPLADPTILAALKKASSIAPIASVKSREANDEEAARLARRKKLLDSHDRDAEDMDLGFGSSRFGDEEDMEERKVKLSVWAGSKGDGDGEGGKDEGKEKRKRGPKKRKGDGNNAADVLKVLERRKEGKK